MKKIFILLFLYSCTTSTISSFNDLNKKNNLKEKVTSNKCINEYLLPCSFVNTSNIDIKKKNETTVKSLVTNIKKNNYNTIITKKDEIINDENSKKNEIIASITKNKILSLSDLPKSDIDEETSFKKYKSYVIKYSENVDYPDINK